ncbi:MAG: ATP-binding protein, partial [Verrucomicrobiales bacterium]
RYRKQLKDCIGDDVSSASIDALSAVSGLRAGGEEFPIEASISKMEIEGKVTSTLILRDITERVRAQQEIRTLNAELELRVARRTGELQRANKELEAFSYSVSHDLRSPLRGIDGWSQALLEDNYEQLDQTGRQYLDRVRSETQRMGSLIDAMLELARVIRTEMQTQVIDLTALAQDVARRLGNVHSRYPVEVSIASGLVAVGDPRLLEIVLNNLIGNAFKFSGKRHGPRVEVGQTQLDGEKVFFVRDNGAGFDMAYASKMFGAFQRMHKVSEYPGTGVGLATVQRIVNRHGGKVWAESVVQQGATFSFTLQEYT